MHIRRFEAPTLLEAVQRVKAELGPDALVLSHRTLRRGTGPFGWLGRATVEVTAAVDRDARRGEPGRVGPDPSWRGLEVTRALIEPLESELRELRRAVTALGGSLPDREVLAGEVARLRTATTTLERDAALCGLEPREASDAARLLSAGVAARHAFPLAREASADAGGGGPEAVLARALAARLDARLVPTRDDDAPGAELFVGPTGAGKTTTLAKLAGRRAEGDGVSIVTTDAERLGADALLRAYSEQIGAPFQVMRRLEDADTSALRRSGRLLVDTAGQGPRDAGALASLLETRAALGDDARVHLVLSATTRDQDLARAVERYRPLGPDRVVLTKLDEASGLGSLVNLLLDEGTPPVAWIADGQRVPQDLHVPDPEELAARIVGVTP